MNIYVFMAIGSAWFPQIHFIQLEMEGGGAFIIKCMELIIPHVMPRCAKLNKNQNSVDACV